MNLRSFEEFSKGFQELDEKVSKMLNSSSTVSVIILTTKRLKDRFDYLEYMPLSSLSCENERVKYKAPKRLFSTLGIRREE